ncbi:conserved hypothetical protein [Candidatus Methylobacter favarea]|uniref:Uncharacterized protein n=1 Tax=Candidatus Methylobacter favarea TaxID=2707345 RepID=A0A8S0X3E2_9GAMM|nr:hypothetical protein [Candidatus Methylobacter favarea]CAA9892664.1 conserved hypothetical protein [Candidatus Methylobacter favarea]
MDAQNRAASRSNRTAAYINKQINTPWTEESILEWQKLRKQTLKQPAISRENACDYKWRNIYVCLPIPANSYSYAEENDYRDVEIFFTAHRGRRQVSESAARLTELMKIPLLKEHFKSAGWAISFPESVLMLTPPVFNNIYKGALGEVCGAYIFKNLLGINLFELDVHEFELFDFKTADGIYVDFKLWSDQIGIVAKEQIEKIRSKIEKTSASRVYIVNILASENTQFKPIISKDGKIIEVPFLCKNSDINGEAINFIGKEFCR